MLTTLPTDRSKLILPDLDRIATETSLVVRKSPHFTPGAFMQSLLSATVTGKASLNQIAADLKNRSLTAMARQSMHERIGPTSTAFLMRVLGELTAQRFAPTSIALADSPIRRIIIEDASAQVMPKANAKEFPAHGNHHGPTAGVKIDLAYDLLTGDTLAHSLHLATEQDKDIGKNIIERLLPGDLVVRDMGYFSLNELTHIENANASWLTRLPLNLHVLLEQNSPIEATLKRTKKDILDQPATAGKQGKTCRLIALRAFPQVAAARREERRKKARKSGKAPCPKGLVRDGWHLMLSNLCAKAADAGKLAVIYRARWAVEIQFRAWKQSLDIGSALNRKSNTHHMHAIILSAMIAHQLGMKIARTMGSAKARAQLSYEKLYEILAGYIIRIQDFHQLADFAPDPRHIHRDKRTRKSPITSTILALT